MSGATGSRQGAPGWVSNGPVHLLLAEGLALPAGFVIFGYCSRVLGVTEFGRLTLIFVFISIAETLIGALLADAANKAVSDVADWRSIGTKVVRVFVLVSGGVALLLVVAADPITAWLETPDLDTVLRLAAFGVFFFGIALAHRMLLVGSGRFSACGGGVASRWVSRVIFILLFLWLSPGIMSAILGLIASNFVELAVLRYFIRPRFFGRSAQSIASLVGLIPPLFLVAMSGFLFANVDLVILQLMGGSAEAVGFYGAAQRFAMSPNAVVLGIAPILLSVMSRSVRQGATDLAARIAHMVFASSLFLIPLAAIVAGSDAEVAALIFGREFAAAGPLLSTLFYAAILRVLVSFAVVIVVSRGQMVWTYFISLVLLPATVIAYIVVIPQFGAPGAAAATLVSSVIGVLFMVFAVYRTWLVFPPLTFLVSCVATSVIGYWLSALWPAEGLILILKLGLLSLLAPVGFLIVGRAAVGDLRQRFMRSPFLQSESENKD